MKNIEEISIKIAEELKAKGVTKARHYVSERETSEYTVEMGEFKLLRTLFDNSASVTVFKGTKKGSASGNDLSPAGVSGVIDSAIASAEAASEDPCYDIAPDQGEHIWTKGAPVQDKDKFFARIKEFAEQASKEFPKLNISQIIAKHVGFHVVNRNTNGTRFEQTGGYYSILAEYAAVGEGITTNQDYAYLSTIDLDTPFLDQGIMRQDLRDGEAQLNRVEVKGKFEGSIILKSDCLANFLYTIVSNYSSDGVLIEGTSQWADKVGQKVADERLTISFDPNDDRMINPDLTTGEDFIVEPFTYIEKGVLKGHILSLYASNKTGKAMAKCTGDSMVIVPGTKSLAEIIKETKRGLIVKSFSGGNPGANGEFSGVVKNSFYVEDGEIKGAVTETMINGNLGEILNTIRDISSDVVCDGSSVLPYIAFDKVVISGK